MVNTIKTGVTCIVKVNRRYTQALIQWSATRRFPVGMEARDYGILQTFVDHLADAADKKDMNLEGFLSLNISIGCIPDGRFKMIQDNCDVVKVLHGIEHECYTERLIALYSPKV